MRQYGHIGGDGEWHGDEIKGFILRRYILKILKKNRGHITVKSDFKKMCHLKFCNVSRSLQVRKDTGSILVFLKPFRKSAISFL